MFYGERREECTYHDPAPGVSIGRHMCCIRQYVCSIGTKGII